MVANYVSAGNGKKSIDGKTWSSICNGRLIPACLVKSMWCHFFFFFCQAEGLLGLCIG